MVQQGTGLAVMPAKNHCLVFCCILHALVQLFHFAGHFLPSQHIGKILLQCMLLPVLPFQDPDFFQSIPAVGSGHSPRFLQGQQQWYQWNRQDQDQHDNCIAYELCSAHLFQPYSTCRQQHGIASQCIITFSTAQHQQQNQKNVGKTQHPVGRVAQQPDQTTHPNKGHGQQHQNLVLDKIGFTDVLQLRSLQFIHMMQQRPVVQVLPNQVRHDHNKCQCSCHPEIFSCK